MKALLSFLLLLPVTVGASECRLTLAGDVMLGRHISEKQRGLSPAGVWGDTLPHLKDSDLTLINHEFVLTQSTAKEEKAFNFRAHPSLIKALKAAGIDFASLGNNHSLDFGSKGLQDTIKTLNQAAIGHAGAGMNAGEAARPHILECGPYKIGVLSFTNNMPEWAAGADKPGVFYLPIQNSSLSTLLPLVRELKSKTDFVVVSAHWGRNWDEAPPEGFRDFAHAVMDAGADIWHGHSGHVIQGVELYKGKPIFYCLGDLIDDYKVEAARNDLAFLAALTLDQNKITGIRILPTAIKDFKAGLAKEGDFDWVASKLKLRSAAFGTQVIRQQDTQAPSLTVKQ